MIPSAPRKTWTTRLKRALLGADSFVEMINYMTRDFGAPVNLGKAKSATVADMKALTAPVQGLEGVMTFGKGHIELWNHYNIVQDTGAAAMSFNWVWSQSPVLFWRIGSNSAQALNPIEAMYLQGWWDVNDGEQYYYYIDSKKAKVWYTKHKPAGPNAAVGNYGRNSGDVTIEPVFKVVMDWDPADGGATRETFSLSFFNPTEMRGVSNRYGPLTARKMFIS